jgi:glycosyltransferase involved in cell wall biosynthesis
VATAEATLVLAVLALVVDAMSTASTAMASDVGAENKANRGPLVSVVTPFLNAGGFIKEAIESVLAQTTPAWELLLIDDGSSDISVALARDYAKAFPDRIRYLQHATPGNRGKSVARNLGIARAKGAYLTFLDADDVFLPHKLEHQIQLLERHPQAVMVYGATEYWNSWDANAGRGEGDEPGRLGVRTECLYEPPQLLVAWLRDPGIVPCICALVARTSAVRSTGGFNEAIQDLFEDQILLVKLLLAGPVYVEGGCAERYRQHSGSTSALAIASGQYHPTRSNPARLIYLEWLEEFLQSRRFLHGDVERALWRALIPYRHPQIYSSFKTFRSLAGRLLRLAGLR